MEKLAAFHVLWTEPMRRTGRSVEACVEDYYLLTMALSALVWKKNNAGTIKLYTDRVFAAFLEERGLLSLWDSCDTHTLHALSGIDSQTFWSVGKFYAYLNEKAPCLCIDPDLILWEKAEKFFGGCPLGFTHWESTRGSSIYPGPEALARPEGYAFDPGWDWNLPAANTSLCYFGDEELKNQYAGEVLRYMRGNCAHGSVTNELLFAEQRLLPFLAEQRGLLRSSGRVFDAVWIPETRQLISKGGEEIHWMFDQLDNGTPVTHIWFRKVLAEWNDAHKRAYCRQAFRMIGKLAPELAERIAGWAMPSGAQMDENGCVV